MNLRASERFLLCILAASLSLPLTLYSQQVTASVQGQVNLGLVASHNPDIIKAYGGMMGGH